MSFSSSLRKQGPILRAVAVRQSLMVKRFPKHEGQGLWVPAFAGTTLKLLSRLANNEDAA
jgi:hypothetical protein